ncbi:MAG: CDP-alcohol phosphatidyltransferase family protein, partial [Planctomycetaceae bacterium]
MDEPQNHEPAPPLRDEASVASQTGNDCYSAGERDWMERTQQWRGKLFQPLLRSLTACRVSPSHLTLLSFIAGTMFAPLWNQSAIIALAALVGHVLLDGLDGPLARYQGVASRRGSFTDT